MIIPRYWAKGEAASRETLRHPVTGREMGPFACWGWSDASVDEARERGRQRANAVVAKLRGGQRPDAYLYGTRPMREQILDEWTDGAAPAYAAVTLNTYGCRVLNTAGIMFVDVDLPPVSGGEALTQRLKRLFGKAGPSPREQRETAALAKVHEMIRVDARLGVRVYRTCAGLRYLITHGRAEPASDATLKAMSFLGADPLYMRLCKTQQCFRARLTPKPWRCGVPALQVCYPWQDAAAEEAVRGWLASYNAAASDFATCTLVAHFGATAMDREIARVVAFHDENTRADSGLPLA